MSWIWYNVSAMELLMVHLSLRVEWAKARAHALRWREELIFIDEKMRRVLAYGQWAAT